MSDQAQQTGMNRGQPLTVSLSAQQWQAVLVMMEAASSSLVAEIHRQCTARLTQPPEPTMSFRRGGNGSAEHMGDAP